MAKANQVTLYLFFDNTDVEMVQDLTRVVHRPCKAPRPLLVGDQPWEHLPYFANNVHTVLRSGEGFMCWYEDWVFDPVAFSQTQADRFDDPAVGSSRICCAFSKDGLHWEKRPLGVVEEAGNHTNIVLGDSEDNRGKFGAAHVPAVLLDPLEDDPSRRFKLMFQQIVPGQQEADVLGHGLGAPQVLRRPIRLASSPDGIHWSVEPVEIDFGGLGPHLGDVFILSCDRERQEYVLHTRHPDAWKGKPNPKLPRTGAWSLPFYPGDPSRLNKRRIWRCESRDLIHWNEPYLVFTTDDEEDNLDDSLYTLTSWPASPSNSEILSLGLVNVFHSVENVMDVQLVFSRDGRTWQRMAQRQPILERGEPGTWDCGFVGVTTPPIRVGDELWIYYGGSNAHHDWWITGLREGLDVPEARDLSMVRHGLGLARLRADGFVSLRAGPVREGLLVTRSMDSAGNHLEINAACGPGGQLAVEITDVNDEVIPGYSRDDSDTFFGDAVTHICTWRHQSQIDCPDKVKLRCWMRNADLYSLRWVK